MKDGHVMLDLPIVKLDEEQDSIIQLMIATYVALYKFIMAKMTKLPMLSTRDIGYEMIAEYYSFHVDMPRLDMGIHIELITKCLNDVTYLIDNPTKRLYIMDEAKVKLLAPRDNIVITANHLLLPRLGKIDVKVPYINYDMYGILHLEMSRPDNEVIFRLHTCLNP